MSSWAGWGDPVQEVILHCVSEKWLDFQQAAMGLQSFCIEENGMQENMELEKHNIGNREYRERSLENRVETRLLSVLNAKLKCLN